MSSDSDSGSSSGYSYHSGSDESGSEGDGGGGGGGGESKGAGSASSPHAPVLKQASYEVLDEIALDERRAALVDEVASITSLPQSEAALLLLAYKWDQLRCNAGWFDSRAEACRLAGIADPDARTAATFPPNAAPCCLCGAWPQAMVDKAAAAAAAAAPPPPPAPSTGAAAAAAAEKKPKKKKKKTKLRKGLPTIMKQLKALKKQNKAAAALGEGSGARACPFSMPVPDNFFTIDFQVSCRGAWEGIVYTFRVTLPEDYPFSAPTNVVCLQHANSLHPNIDASDGNVCVSMLRDSWCPAFSLSDVAWGLAEIFAQPNWSHCLNNDALELWQHNRAGFYTRLRAQGATNPEQAEAAAAAGAAGGAGEGAASAAGDEGAAGAAAAAAVQGDKPTCESTDALGCGHYLCENCWSGYLESRVTKDGAGCIYARCPGAKDCSCLVTKDLVAKHLSDDLVAKYDRYVLRSYVQDNAYARYCPNADGGCTRIIEYPKNQRNRVIQCVCGHDFCYGCGEAGGHTPLSCDMLDVWAGAKKQFEGQSAADLWMAKNCKRCPKKIGGCGRMILKNGGCMHMTCRRAEGGCGFEWCWLCLGPWSEHGSKTGGYYACNNYTAMAKKGTLKGEAKAAYEAEKVEEDQKRILAFYEFHVQRHVFMKSSADDARARDLAPLRAKLEACLTSERTGKVGRWQKERTQVLVHANKTVERCRRMLQWIYVAAYYFPRETGVYSLFKKVRHALLFLPRVLW